jgi:hypothetical protein
MARVSDLCRDFASRFDIEESRVTGVARALREAGLITQGARGVNAPHATALDAARLLIALMADRKIKESPAAVNYFGALRLKIRVPASAHMFADGESFETAFATVIGAYGSGLHHSRRPLTVRLTPFLGAADISRDDPDESYNFIAGDLVEHAKAIPFGIGFRVSPLVTQAELGPIGQLVRAGE